MAHVENTVTVDRPIDEVFDYLADGTNSARWRKGILEIRRTSQTKRVGATYRQILSGPGGRRMDGDYRVTAYDRPHRIEFAVTTGPAKPNGRFELVEAGAGRTTVTFSLDLQPAGVMRLAGKLIESQMRTEVGQLDRLKQDLESR